MRLLASTWIATLACFVLTACPAKPVTKIEIKPAKPIKATLDKFQKAWNEGSRGDITAFLARDVRKRKNRLLTKLFRRRTWEEKRPPITEETHIAVDTHQVTVPWAIEGDEKYLQTNWQWENDDWFLVNLNILIRK